MRFAPQLVELDKRPDGTMLLRSPQKLGAHARCVTEWLVRWSDDAPQRIFLAERAGTGWRSLPYREAYGQVRRVAQGLLNLGLGAGGRSPSFRTTASAMPSCRLARCTSASRWCRSRPPTR